MSNQPVSARSKVYDNTQHAVHDIADGASIAVGGFGLCGVPFELFFFF